MVAFDQVYVLEIIVLGKDVAWAALLEKVDMRNFVALEVDVLEVDHDLWLEKRADPSDEGAGLFKHQV